MKGKIRLGRFLIVIAVVVLFVGCQSSSPEKVVIKVKPYQPEQAQGTWIGFCQADLFLYEVRLDQEGKGVFASDSPLYTKPRVVRIGKWNLEGLNTLLVDFEKNQDLVSFKGAFVTETMIIGWLHGSTHWSNEMSLYKQSALQTRVDRLDDAISKSY
jgi:hypothetical protein